MTVHRLLTEHRTEVLIEDSDEHVEVILAFDEFEGPVYLSLTAKEARQVADALLTRSQRVEDRLPHGNS